MSFTPGGGFDCRRHPVVALARRRDYYDRYRVARLSCSPGGGLSPFDRLDGTGRGLHLRRTHAIRPNVYMTCLLFVATSLIERTFFL
jgi:hypothetical protein